MISHRALAEGDAGWGAARPADPDVSRYADPRRIDGPATFEVMVFVRPGVVAAPVAVGRELGFVLVRVGERHAMKDHRYELRCA